MSARPMPTPPRARFVPALVSVSERRGITVVVDRQPNLCRWAIHTLSAAGAPLTISGPSAGQPANPSNTELATQISAAVAGTGITADKLYCAERVTADLLRAKTNLPVVDLVPPPEALAAAREAISLVERRAVTGLTLACDSSRGRGSINGCGWVLDYSSGADPVVGTYTTVAEYGGIRAGELAAIRRGLQATLNLHPVLREGVGTLTVLTDSKAALDLLARVESDGTAPGADSDSLGECRRILGSARGITITFKWVRGHDGHHLNELADRLAVLARRNRESDVDEFTHAQMVAGVRNDARLAVAELRAA